MINDIQYKITSDSSDIDANSANEQATCAICSKTIFKNDVEHYIENITSGTPVSTATPSPSAEPSLPLTVQAACFLPDTIRQWHRENYGSLAIQKMLIKPHDLPCFTISRCSFDYNNYFSDVYKAVCSFNPDIYIAIPRGGLIPTFVIAGACRQHGNIRIAKFRTKYKKDNKNDLCCRLHGIGLWKPLLRIAILEFVKSGTTLTTILQDYDKILSAIHPNCFNLKCFGIDVKHYNKNEKPRQILDPRIYLSKNVAPRLLDDNNAFYGKSRIELGRKHAVSFSCGSENGTREMTGYEYVLWKISYAQRITLGDHAKSQ